MASIAEQAGPLPADDVVLSRRRAGRKSEQSRLTILVPVYNEQEAIPPFLAKLDSILDQLNFDWSILFINDGSQDATLNVLLDASRRDERIKTINFARNFGKEAALTAGLDTVDADAVIIMDVDLQDPPELISEFVKLWLEGYDVVYGVRTSRSTDGFLKRWTAEKFYALFNAISTLKIPANVGDYRLIDQRVVTVLRTVRERSRFMKGLFAWVGYPAAAVPFERPLRTAGRTKFGFRRLWNFALDGIFGFSALPLKAWTYCGLAVAMAAILYAFVIMFRTLIFGISVPGYASIMVVVLVLGAAQLISLGILGEYIARIVMESKQRPIYVIENIYGAKDDD